MDPDFLRKQCSSTGGQKETLDALHDDALRDIITPAGALAFGAVPIAEADGTLFFGTAGAAHPDCAGALAAAVERKVELVTFDEGLLREAIERFYLRRRHSKEGAGPEAGQETGQETGQEAEQEAEQETNEPDGASGIDLATFESPDFLRDPDAAARMLVEKDGALPKRDIRLPRGRMAVLDLRLHSVLRSLDRERDVQFAPTASTLPFRLRVPPGEKEPEAVLFRDQMPGDDLRAIVAASIFYDGDEHLHAVVGHDLEHTPLVLHPSEMQLVEIDRHEAGFHVYDHTETVKAGVPSREEPVSLSCRYWFLHYGRRLERTLHLDVLAFELVLRTRVRLAGSADRLVPADLERLFGLDFPKAEAPKARPG